MNKQVTITIDEYHLDKIKAIAEKSFDGNFSMALRSILRNSPQLEEKSE